MNLVLACDEITFSESGSIKDIYRQAKKADGAFTKTHFSRSTTQVDDTCRVLARVRARTPAAALEPKLELEKAENPSILNICSIQ